MCICWWRAPTILWVNSCGACSIPTPSISIPSTERADNLFEGRYKAIVWRKNPLPLAAKNFVKSMRADNWFKFYGAAMEL
jgi:hypothetical protein